MGRQEGKDLSNLVIGATNETYVEVGCERKLSGMLLPARKFSPARALLVLVGAAVPLAKEQREECDKYSLNKGTRFLVWATDK